MSKLTGMQQTVIKDGRKYIKAYYNPATGETKTDKKAKARYLIQKEIIDGKDYDIFDIIADQAKRLNMLEKGMMLLLKDLSDKGTLPESISTKYSNMINAYNLALDNDEYTTRTDLKEDNDATFNELLRRDAKITDILIKCGFDERPKETT